MILGFAMLNPLMLLIMPLVLANAFLAEPADIISKSMSSENRLFYSNTPSACCGDELLGGVFFLRKFSLGFRRTTSHFGKSS